MGENAKFILSQEELNQIGVIASREAVRAYKAEQKKEKMDKKKARNTEKIKKTKHMLSSYRRMKLTLSQEVIFSKEEKIELRWKFLEDLMGNANSFVERSELTIVNNEKKRQENLYCIACIDNAIELYQEECEKSSSEEYKRRFRELYAMYIAEETSTVQEIANVENVSEKTVYKDLGISCSILSIYLLGM